MPLPTALVSHPACNRHDTGPGHPGSRARLPALLEAARRDADLAPRLSLREATPAAEEDLLRVHTPEHVVWIRQVAAEAGRRGEILRLGPDTAVSADSWDAALAAGGKSCPCPLPALPHDPRRSPSEENFWMRLLSESATYTSPTASPV